ncbi:MAG: dTDP-4-dehydrorhamnose reductase [Pseudomonadota bacterium]
MKVLLTGANGQVGWEVCRQLPEHGHTLVATTRQQLDLSNATSLQQAVSPDIDLIVNAAAYTAVDKAESDAELARAVNATAPGLLATLCAERKIPLVHISTDYVFDGTATRAYREDDPVAPLGVYGSTKLDGELAVQRALDTHLILRTSWVFGVHGNNFVKTMIRLAGERSSLSVVADQIGAPTFAGSIAAAICQIANRIELGEAPWGTYHFCDDGPTTWHSFAVSVIALAHEAGLIASLPDIVPIRTSQYPTPAQRPGYSVLNTRKFQAQFPDFALRSWQDGVRDIIAALNSTAGKT